VSTGPHIADGTAVLTPLAWDSAHFGCPVARLNAPGGDTTGVAGALGRARREGVALVYWQVEPNAVISPALLTEFGGRLVDRKATFAAELTALELGEAGASVVGVDVHEVPPGPASEALIALAVAAGEFSRFRVDPLIPRDRFVSLYAIWVERSVRRELADCVLVAATEERDSPLGFVTVAEAGGQATIGLIAVAAAARARGLGRLLMRAAHRWMAARGAVRASVVTQADNVGACHLYERCGYRLEELRPCYHFWLQVGRPHEER